MRLFNKSKEGETDILTGFSEKKNKYGSELVTDDAPQPKVGNSWRDYPKTVFCIVSNEFCERFSYYGMRTVLVLYLINIINLDDDSATAAYHGFIVLCYTTPLLGSILADGYIGKYHTILWVSLLYASGNILLAVASFWGSGINPHPWLDALGLIVIGFGTGGIKPCVSAFGGDQFLKGQERMLETFFSVFYFSINAGSTISSFITPYFRTLPCAGQESCYPLAFGMPAILMIVATGMFLIGTPWYRRTPPQDNVIGKTFKCIITSIQNKSRHHLEREHWLDHYVDDEGDPKEMAIKTQFKEDVKALLRVCVMYLPVPVFWALFDQQGSRWVIQGVAMDGRFGSFTLLPDQMPTLNAVLIMAFIPIFQFLIYPGVRLLGVDPSPLRRMSMGGFFAAASFVIAAFVQLKVNTTLRFPPTSNNAEISFSNTLPCPLTFTQLTFNGVPASSNAINFTLPKVTLTGSQSFDHNKPVSKSMLAGNYVWACTGTCITRTQFNFTLAGGSTYSTPIVNSAKPTAYAYLNSIDKPQTGQGQSKVSVIGLDIHAPMEYYFCANDNGNSCSSESDNPLFIPVRPRTSNRTDIVNKKHQTKTFAELLPGNQWNLFQKLTSTNVTIYQKINGTLYNKQTQGGIYSMTLYQMGTQTHSNLHTIVAYNSVSLLLQIPQYVVITAAEIMFSITGLEFSYSQAPASMKSVIQAMWLLTVAGGDLIVLVIAEARIFKDLALELFVYAGLMAFVMVIFTLMSVFYYEYSNVAVTGEVDDEEDSEFKA